MDNLGEVCTKFSEKIIQKLDIGQVSQLRYCLSRLLMLAGGLISAALLLNGCATPVGSGDPHAATRQRIVRAAEQLVGTPYIWGGESPGGMDCSGLTRYAYAQVGIRLPRRAVEQFQTGQRRQRLLPGDLLFFRTGTDHTISHVGIYVGQGQMIHASSGAKQVRKVSLNQPYWQRRMMGGATFLGNEPRPVVRDGGSRHGLSEGWHQGPNG